MGDKKYGSGRTLIVGEVGSGKTARTLRILRDLRKTSEGPWGILDFAPEEVGGVGGKLPLSDGEREGMIYLSPPIVPPRLRGKSEDEVLRLAGENRRQIEQVLPLPRDSGVRVLFINDLSLYFHAGSAGQLWLQIGKIPTVVMNGYYGSYFGDSPISRRERSEMELLMARCDRVLYIPPRCPANSPPPERAP